MTKKKEFDWEEGGTLGEENFSPLGGIRARGLSKIHNAPAKDPQVRKQEREKYLAGAQSRTYQSPESKPVDINDPQWIAESDGDISGVHDTSDAFKRLTEAKHTGKTPFDRFGKK